MGGLSNALGINNGFNAANAAGNNPFITQQQFQPQIEQANQGVQSNIANQNSFAQALQAQMNGAGPNLANSQLANATGQNVANQAALMAGQRGSSSNAGLIARQAAQQGANIQQQAAGQAAVNRAQQQLGAESQLGNVYGNIGSEAGQNLATFQGGQQAQNSTIANSTNAANQINSQTAAANNAQNAGLVSGAMNSGSSILSSLAQGGPVQRLDDGGMAQPTSTDNNVFAFGATNNHLPTQENMNSVSATGGPGAGFAAPANSGGGGDSGQPRSNLGQGLANAVSTGLDASTGPSDGSQIAQAAQTGKDIGTAIFSGGLGKSSGSSSGGGGGGGGGGGLSGLTSLLALAAKGGKVPALLSPGERSLKPDQVEEVAKGKANPMKVGEKIPGKPKVPGAVDSYKNDTVPKVLDEGGVIIPRHITQGKNPVPDSIAFVKATLAKKRKGVK